MDQRNPWKKISTKPIYKNPWISVREDQVITPSGEEGIYGVIETKTAVGVIALNEHNEIYLVGQYRYPVDIYSWEIVEGGSDGTESPLATAKRELKEETGIVAKDWTKLGTEIHMSNCFSDEVGHLFLARDLEFEESSPDDTEILEVKSVDFEKALSLCDSGEIKDSLSIIAIHRLHRLFSQQDLK